MLYANVDTSKPKDVIFLEIHQDLIFLIHRYRLKHHFNSQNEAIEHMILKELNIRISEPFKEIEVVEPITVKTAKK